MAEACGQIACDIGIGESAGIEELIEGKAVHDGTHGERLGSLLGGILLVILG